MKKSSLTNNISTCYGFGKQPIFRGIRSLTSCFSIKTPIDDYNKNALYLQHTEF